MNYYEIIVYDFFMLIRELKYSKLFLEKKIGLDRVEIIHGHFWVTLVSITLISVEENTSIH